MSVTICPADSDSASLDARAVLDVPRVDGELHESTRVDRRCPWSLHDLVPHGHPLGELAYVGDDADHPVVAAEGLERRGDRVERVGVERAEALVEEDRIELGRAAGRHRADLIGERERQGQRRLERLAARQRLRRPPVVGVAMVDHLELVALVHGQRVLVARQQLERLRCAEHQPFECLVDEPLLEPVRLQSEGELASDLDLVAHRLDALRQLRRLLHALRDAGLLGSRVTLGDRGALAEHRKARIVVGLDADLRGRVPQVDEHRNQLDADRVGAFGLGVSRRLVSRQGVGRPGNEALPRPDELTLHVRRLESLADQRIALGTALSPSSLELTVELRACLARAPLGLDRGGVRLDAPLRPRPRAALASVSCVVSTSASGLPFTRFSSAAR